VLDNACYVNNGVRTHIPQRRSSQGGSRKSCGCSTSETPARDHTREVPGASPKCRNRADRPGLCPRPTIHCRCLVGVAETRALLDKTTGALRPTWAWSVRREPIAYATTMRRTASIIVRRVMSHRCPHPFRAAHTPTSSHSTRGALLLALVFAPLALLLLTASALGAGAVQEFPVKLSPGLGHTITLGPDGNVWFGGQTEPSYRIEHGMGVQVGDIHGVVAKVSPRGAVSEYNIAFGFYSGSAEIRGITPGPDGNLWFTANVHLPNGTYQTYDGRSHLPDGRVTLPGEPLGLDLVGKITTAGVISDYVIGTTVISPPSSPPPPPPAPPPPSPPPPPPPPTGPPSASRMGPRASLAAAPLGSQIVSGIQAFDITAGPDGNLWFTGDTNLGGGVIGKITTSGKVTEYTAGISGPVENITLGPDGNLWFTGTRFNEMGNVMLGKITTSGVVTEYSAGIGGLPGDITAGPDGNLWFTEGSRKKIGKITPGGAVTEYRTGIISAPAGITVGADRNLWFTEPFSRLYAKITTRGVVTTYSYGRGFATGITRGADGHLWLCARVSDTVVRLSPPTTKKRGGHKRRGH
jgi:streptogramin lyase